MKKSSRTPKFPALSPSAVPTTNSAPTWKAYPTTTSAATRCSKQLPSAAHCHVRTRALPVIRSSKRQKERWRGKELATWLRVSVLGRGGLGTALFHVIRGLLVCFLGLGFGIGVRRKLLNCLAETHRTGAGHFCFERVEATGDIQVLRHVSRCNALAQILEAVARRLRLLAGQRLDLAGNGCVMAQHIARRSV